MGYLYAALCWSRLFGDDGGGGVGASWLGKAGVWAVG